MFMNTNEQWFQPGDKVMRIAYAADLGLNSANVAVNPATDFGIVLCVEHCWRPRLAPCNAVDFVGVFPKSNESRGFAAACFRKVEEIKLCVRAAEKFHQPATTEPETAEA
jgi:hypothetical protein